MKDPDHTHRSRIPDATGDRAEHHPLRGRTGAGRGSWRFAMVVIVVAVVAAFVVILLVNQGTLDRGWAYAVLPVAIVAAAAARVLTIFKAAGEEKRR